MTTRQFDVVCVGNALVDVQAKVEDSFVAKHGPAKGGMRLVDAAQAEAIYNDLPPAHETSGGSGANSIAVLASLGGKGGFIGRVAADELGAVFAHDLKAQGVAFAEAARDTAEPTGRCLIAVTPDGERTMNTSLGCNVNFGPADLSASMIESAKVFCWKGICLTSRTPRKPFRAAVKIAKAAGVEVALTLSAEFCVNFHRADFLQLLKEGVDILFANEEEIKALYQVDSFEDAARQVDAHCKVAVLTKGAAGALYPHEGRNRAGGRRTGCEGDRYHRGWRCLCRRFSVWLYAGAGRRHLWPHRFHLRCRGYQPFRGPPRGQSGRADQGPD
jgi:sugar/nucleoside kinase (ribokinase family)